MFRKLPGDQVSGLVSTTPDTAVVFKPAVVNTPAILTVFVLVWRLASGLGKTVIRHPIVASMFLAAGVV